MEVTQEEKLMYRVMCAIFESRIPIDFKGAMVLHAYLYEKFRFGGSMKKPSFEDVYSRVNSFIAPFIDMVQ